MTNYSFSRPFQGEVSSLNTVAIGRQLNHYWRSWQLSQASKAEILTIQSQLQQVTHDGFGSKEVSFSKKDIEKALSFSTHVAFLQHWLTGQIGGFAFYFVSDEPLLVGKYAYINNVCVSKRIQGSGHSSGLIREILLDRDIAWLGARTQNPHVIRLLMKYASLTYPFDTTYDDVCGEEVLSYVRQFIPQVSHSSQDATDPITGICRNYYGRRLGDFPITTAVRNIERRLAELSFCREQGDAVLVSSFINHKIELTDEQR